MKTDGKNRTAALCHCRCPGYIWWNSTCFTSQITLKMYTSVKTELTAIWKVPKQLKRVLMLLQLKLNMIIFIFGYIMFPLLFLVMIMWVLGMNYSVLNVSYLEVYLFWKVNTQPVQLSVLTKPSCRYNSASTLKNNYIRQHAGKMLITDRLLPVTCPDPVHLMCCDKTSCWAHM